MGFVGEDGVVPSAGDLPGVAGLMSGRTAPAPGQPPGWALHRRWAGAGAPGEGGGKEEPADLLPAPWPARLRLIVGASMLWVLGWGLAVRGSHGPLGVERPLNDLLTRSRPHLVHVAFAFASLNKPGVFAAVLAVMLGLCAAGRSARAAAALLVALPVTFVVCEVLKLHCDRVNAVGTATYPSGHVGVASALATVIGLLARRHGPLGRRLARPVAVGLMVTAAAAVGAVAASMVILGNHFVTDTIAAVPIGLSITLVAARAADLRAGPSAPGR
jgi:hypothetical protein